MVILKWSSNFLSSWLANRQCNGFFNGPIIAPTQGFRRRYFVDGLNQSFKFRLWRRLNWVEPAFAFTLCFFMFEKKKALTVVVSQCESPIKGNKNILHVGVYITCIAHSTGTHPGLFLALTRAKFETSFTKVHTLIRYVKILTWLRGLRVKIANFSRLHCLASPRRDLSTKKTKPNREKSPESLSIALFGNSTFSGVR